ncbi:hypothetical protein BGZ51_002967 [Haplosporangium sp. Z 767]|nr:hypothetical protein BGZ51_002967 [Haplosporangium sp. Z 767]KAF9196878.1 hypothetical protein BGZ50_005953 [Haplosporangium sp. Z 11]
MRLRYPTISLRVKEFEEPSEELTDLVVKDQFRLATPKVYSIQDVCQVHDGFEGKKTTRKLLLNVNLL